MCSEAITAVGLRTQADGAPESSGPGAPPPHTSVLRVPCSIVTGTRA
ncbi:hypothetical protein QFZ76_009756 [Streptomyces sp. V4I2]|nr:hypothetical protein [Streptomyces sp. V4I2]